LIPSIKNIVNQEENVSSKFRMESTDFIDGLGEHSHSRTIWQLSTGEHFLSSNLVFDEKTSLDLLSFNPDIFLSFDFVYYCRVKHIDSSSEESRWSDTITFITELDTDDDGISDTWEDVNDRSGAGDLSPISDPDGDNIPNRFEYYFGLDPNANDSKGSIGLQPVVEGNIFDYRSNDNVATDFIIISDLGRTVAVADDGGNYFGLHPSGTFTFTIFADYYYPRIFKNIVVPETDVHQIDFILIPMTEKDAYIPTDNGDPDPDPDPDNGGGDGTGCFIISLIHVNF